MSQRKSEMVNITRGGQPEPCPFPLPVSGHLVALQHPTGAEDLLLIEATGDDTKLTLALASRLTRFAAGAELDWSELTVSDLDVLILRLRQAVIGDRVRADVACRAADCGKRFDISFGIGRYLAHREPSKPSPRGAWNVDPAEEPGWFRLTRARSGPGKLGAGTPTAHSEVPAWSTDRSDEVLFRPPTVADQLAVVGRLDAAEELARRCIRPMKIPLRLRRQVEATMEAMAPSMSGDLQGTCPECGSEVAVYFEARQFCLRELRDRAAFIYQDIDLLARRYRWSETDILAMPHARRTNYAELARQEGVER
jgi:hypothetical protein